PPIPATPCAGPPLARTRNAPTGKSKEPWNVGNPEAPPPTLPAGNECGTSVGRQTTEMPQVQARPERQPRRTATTRQRSGEASAQSHDPFFLKNQGCLTVPDASISTLPFDHKRDPEDQNPSSICGS